MDNNIENLPANPSEPLPERVVDTAIAMNNGINPFSELEAKLRYEIALFEFHQRKATLLSKSTMLPKMFHGSISNCMIGMDLAESLQMDRTAVMQNMYVVPGSNKPGMEAKLMVSLLNRSGIFSRLNHVFSGEDETRECTAYATELKTGEVFDATCTMKIAKAEGWLGKANSKWKTNPDQMLIYRSDAFFIKRHCPEILMGCDGGFDKEEIVDAQQGCDGSYSVKEKSLNKIEALKKRISENAPPVTVVSEVVGPEISEPFLPEEEFPTDFNETMGE